MKIALLTMVFNNNYGGMLQAYALQTYLSNIGHETTLINVQNVKITYWNLAKTITKRLILKFIFRRQNIGKIVPAYFYRKETSIIEAHTRHFVDKYIGPKTKPVYTAKDIQKLVGRGFDAYIVGSDQVWRPTMYKFIDQAFFGFVEEKNTIRLSYAPSFGVDFWEYTEEQTKKYSKQLKDFKAVSVRESSGVELCNKYFNIEAVQLVDPTLLLSTSDYINLVAEESTPISEGDFLVYVLDMTDDKRCLIEEIAKKYMYTPFSTNIKDTSGSAPLEDRIYPSVTSWIRGFMDAKFIFTDSFHGCIFSILFNKPFIVFGNERRGMARFNSLLNMFRLEDRLILSKQDVTLEKKLTLEIDWDSVNSILEEQRAIAFNFFSSNLAFDKTKWED